MTRQVDQRDQRVGRDRPRRRTPRARRVSSAIDDEDQAAEHHLDAGGDERPARQRRPCDANSEPLAQAIGETRIAARPSGSSAPAPPNADGPTRMATPTKPSDDAGHRQPRQPLAEEDPAEDGDPDRHHRDEQRGDARWDGLLAEGDHAHAAAEQQRADDRAVAPLPARRRDGTSDRRGRPTRRAGQPGDQEPDRGHQERRDRLDGDRDAEVGRAPDHVEDEQPDPDRRARDRGGGRVGIAGGPSNRTVVRAVPVDRDPVQPGVLQARGRRQAARPTPDGRPCRPGSRRLAAPPASGTGPGGGR